MPDPARPVLGVVCCTRTVGVEPAQAVINRYVTAAMTFADAAALLVPALPDLMKPAEIAPRLDGILLTGSPSNVAPERYGQKDESQEAGPFDPARDSMTVGLIEAMIGLGKPVFGVCRGFQELNVAFGGALRRDTGRNPDLLEHHARRDVAFLDMFDHEHDVELAPGGVLSRAFGRDRLRVNSVHYQGVARLGDGLKIEARSPDGLIEAVSANVGGAPVLGVQWHPEWETDKHPDSQVFFRLLGRALRGEAITARDPPP